MGYWWELIEGVGETLLRWGTLARNGPLGMISARECDTHQNRERALAFSIPEIDAAPAKEAGIE